MSWTNWYSCLSEAFKKRAGRYIVNRYLGSFLEDGAVLLDQLSTESGELTLENVSLDSKNINGILESTPLELVDGYIRELRVSIPWSSLLSENCHFSILGLTLTLAARPPPPQASSSSTFHSMYESFSSMNLAQDVSKEEESLIGDPVGGVQYLAEAIDSILTRLRVSLLDTVIRIEYVPGLETRGLALELRISEVVYSGHQDANDPSSSSLKKVLFRQVDLLSDEFVFRNAEDNEELLEDQPPLRLARLSGSTELILHFSEEKNDYGLPSVLEEFDINCGLLAVHIYPHQIHTVMEIAKSIFFKPQEPLMHHKHHHNIENLLQKKHYFTATIQSSYAQSVDKWFHVGESPSTVEFPKISIKIACFISAFIERDENISKLGGNYQKIFLKKTLKFPPLQKNRLNILHDYVTSACKENSHIQVVGAPLKICMKDISHITVSVGELSVRELILSDPRSSPEIYQILDFSSSTEIKRNPDLKVKISHKCPRDEKNCLEIIVAINPVILEVDLGIVDRVYCLLNYSEMDPTCIKTIMDKSQQSSSFELSLTSSQVKINFYVPKIDLRSPPDIPSFVEYFWSRHVHSESLVFSIDELMLTSIAQNDVVNLNISSDLVRIFYVEEDAHYDLIEIKKSLSSEGSSSSAATIFIQINLDESKRLFWKFDKSLNSKSSEEYLISGANVENTLERTLDKGISKQILEALSFGQTNNNVLIDLSIDDISIILPSKHIYEIIYNRLGNDLLLWFPLIYRVKEYIFGILFDDPLKYDDNFGFSTGYSNQVKDFDEYEENITCSSNNSSKKSFPKCGKNLCIHVDTTVLLKVGSGKILICPNVWYKSHENNNKALLASVQKLSLSCVVGLERDPEIIIFNLKVDDGSIKYGHSTCNKQEHFLNDPNLHSLFEKTDFCRRAWLDVLETQLPLLEITSKILFNSKSNLKKINLSFALQEASILMSSENLELQYFIEWIIDFFTVVEYPIVGYNPPVILTEMQFDIKRSSLDLHFPAKQRLTLSLGSMKMSCNFLDSSLDMSIALCLEDVGLFLSQDSIDPVESSICFCDLDYLDLYVFLKENFEKPPILDITCSCNLLRVRTCADTIKILTKLVSEFIEEHEKAFTKNANKHSRTVITDQEVHEVENVFDESEDVVPDIAEAMEDLLRDTLQENKKETKDTKKMGGHVFFFPDEANPNQFPDSLGMTQSFYADPDAMSASDIRQKYSIGESDTFDEEFCILDNEIGTGIISRSGEPTVRCLLDSTDNIVMIDNHFSIPDQSIDYLRTPKNFPKFQTSFTLKKLSVLWKMYGGNDFSSSKELALNTKSQLQKMGMSLYVDPQTSVILCNDGNILKRKERTPPGRSARLLADNLKTKGGPGRNEEQLIEICIHKLQLKHEVYNQEANESSRQILIVPLLEICDRLAISDINKLLYPYASRTRPQRSNANMLTYKCVNLRKENNINESNVHVSLQPFRINIDQDTLFFIIDFGCALIPNAYSAAIPPKSFLTESERKVKYNNEMETIIIQEESSESQGQESVDSITTTTSQSLSPPPSESEKRSQPQPFIKSFVFSHSVPIRIDYLGKYVDLTHGTLKGLLVGLAQLNCSELTLKKVSYQSGILGLDKLFKLLLMDWFEDVKQNQVPSLLGGVGPMYSFLQLMQGIKDLILLPLEQYQKDGRLMRGIQKGANSFTASTAMGILDMTNRMLGLIKFMAEIAFDIMSPDGPALHSQLPSIEHKRLRRKRTIVSRPSDMREGIFNALVVVRDGFDETARTLIEAASNERSKKGISGAVGGVLKQVPSTMMKPVIVAASATSNVLEGVKNQVAPEGRKEEEEKWRKL
ncbi:autophagy-related protein 2 homolog B [Lepeophtheirus salmonis]|uniref:autophagy-related protein 2 homolog B n=1 Tax=Lepeophtheirus salmonis TaxID=72036 RepID=UPI003AF3DD5A